MDIGVDGDDRRERRGIARFDPFPLLQSVMPPDVWDRVADALEEVLGDERDGDPRLHAMLVRTLQAEQERANQAKARRLARECRREALTA
jgi:hypothetical protein